MGWAKGWLEQVGEAAKAIRYETLASERRREAMLSLGTGSGSIGAQSGARDPMERVDALIDAEAETQDLDWAHELVDDFTATMRYIRREYRDYLVAASYVAEMRYLQGMTVREIADVADVSRRTVYDRLELLIDWLDFVGPAGAKGGEE